mmetsp:Transcript_18584/g.47071  ORF Transcript_18584/g.47071 Transcript_18584/m.47071 type:complete len:239 (+) Transcript_18584:178-894(+)
MLDNTGLLRYVFRDLRGKSGQKGSIADDISDMGKVNGDLSAFLRVGCLPSLPTSAMPPSRGGKQRPGYQFGKHVFFTQGTQLWKSLTMVHAWLRLLVVLTLLWSLTAGMKWRNRAAAINAMQIRLVGVQTQLDELVARNRERIGDLKEQVDSLQNKVQAIWKEKHLISFEDSKVERKLKEEQEKAGKLEQQNAQLQKSLQANTADVERLKSEVSQAQSEMNKINESLKKLMAADGQAG